MMALAISSPDHFNFYRYSTLLIDVGGDALRLVIKKFCHEKNLSFQDFLSIYKDALFHGRKTQNKCSKCPHTPPLSNGGAFEDDQWKLLYVVDADLKELEEDEPSDKSRNDCPETWKVNPSIELKQLEINFLADILHNVRDVLLYVLYDHMRHYGQTKFESFLNHNKHVLYHHCKEGKCCLCTPQIQWNSAITIFENQWKSLFRKSGICLTCSSQDCCTVYFGKSIQEDTLSMNVLSKVLKLTVPVFEIINSIIEKRHTVYGHPKNDTRMDEKTFQREWQVLSELILGLIMKIEEPGRNNEWKDRIDCLIEKIPTDDEYNEILDRLKTMETQESMIYQELNEAKRRQNMILREVSRKRRDNMKLTKFRIRDHMEGLRVQTEYVERGINVLKENGILIYTGISGEGKTWHCLEVLSTLHGKDVVQLDSMRLDISKLDTYVGADQKDIVVWIDDLKAASVQNHKPFFERIQAQISKGDLNIIISITRTELKRITESNLEIFKDRFIVVLGDESNLEKDFELKTNILHAFLCADRSTVKSFGTFFPKYIVRNINEENLGCEPYKISNQTIKRIAKIKTDIGFPECCRRFCTDPDLFKKGESFFKYPSETTKMQIAEMANSHNNNIRNKFLVLCLVLIFPFDIDSNFRQMNVPNFLLEILSVNLDKWSYQRALKGLIPSYLIKDAYRKIVSFQDETIRLAVAITLCDFGDEAINYFISNGPLDLVLDLCRTEFQQKNPSLPSPFHVDCCSIFHRLVQEMGNTSYRYSIKQIFWYIGTDNPTLWTKFLQYIAENESFDKNSKIELEKIIKLNIPNPAKLFGTKESISEEQNDESLLLINLLFDVDVVDKLKAALFLILLLYDVDVISFPPMIFLNMLFKIICFLTQGYGQLLHLISERLCIDNFNILQDRSLYSENSVREFIHSLDTSQRHLMIMVLSFLEERGPSNYKVRDLCFHVASLIPSHDLHAILGEPIMVKIGILRDASKNTTDGKTISNLRNRVLRACHEKDLLRLQVLQSDIIRNKEFKDKLLENASTPTFSSYSLDEVVRIFIEDENNCTCLLNCFCKDIEILDKFCASDERLLSILKKRFLTTEFSSSYILTSLPLLADSHFSEYECCSVEQCLPNTDFEKHQYLDCCIIMTQKADKRSQFPMYLQRYLCSFCNKHFADLCFMNVFSKYSLEFEKAVDEMEKHRISSLSFFTSKLGKYIDEIFFYACKVGSHLMVRHILEEEFEINVKTLTDGLKTTCLEGHSLVVDKLLSWKSDLISLQCISDCLQTTIENNQNQTMAYILTSEQVTTYLKDGSAKGDDSLYCIIRKAIRICESRYLSKIFSFYMSKSILTGIALIVIESNVYYSTPI